MEKSCFGGHSERETPGPIPNPEVKPPSADGTAAGTLWETRTPPDHTHDKCPLNPPGSRGHFHALLEGATTAERIETCQHPRTPTPIATSLPTDGVKIGPGAAVAKSPDRMIRAAADPVFGEGRVTVATVATRDAVLAIDVRTATRGGAALGNVVRESFGVLLMTVKAPVTDETVVIKAAAPANAARVVTQDGAVPGNVARPATKDAAAQESTAREGSRVVPRIAAVPGSVVRAVTRDGAVQGIAARESSRVAPRIVAVPGSVVRAVTGDGAVQGIAAREDFRVVPRIVAVPGSVVRAVTRDGAVQGIAAREDFRVVPRIAAVPGSVVRAVTRDGAVQESVATLVAGSPDVPTSGSPMTGAGSGTLLKCA